MIDVGGQKSPQQVYFGTDSRVADPARFVVPIEAIAGVFFVLIALVFVGLGQVMGRRFDAIPDRLTAYSADIVGSLTGIIAFGAASYWRIPATLWFALGLAIGSLFHAAAPVAARGRRARRAFHRGHADRLAQDSTGPRGLELWSPYNLVTVQSRHFGSSMSTIWRIRGCARWKKAEPPTCFPTCSTATRTGRRSTTS